jgi:hypothetical protein
MMKYPLKPDANLNARCERFLAGRPRTRQYTMRTAAELANDVNQLSDLLVGLVQDRDRLHCEARNLKLWIRILRYAVIAEAGIIAWFATELFSRI